MDKKWKGKIINALRRLSYGYPPRSKAKNKQKVAPATFECEHCKIWVYEGSKELDKLDLDPPNGLTKGKVNHDHIEPIVPLEGYTGGDWNWHEYIERMFCDDVGFQILCSECHDIKTKKEDEIRLKNRKKTLTKKKKSVKVKS